MKFNKFSGLVALGLILASYLLATPVSAHEAYVLSHQQLVDGLMQTSSHPLQALFLPQNLMVTAIVTIFVSLLYLSNFVWAITPIASRLDKLIKKARVFGPLITRLTVSASFFFAAMNNSILGPELSLSQIPGGWIIRILLFLLSFLMLFGLFTEFGGLLAMGILAYITRFFGIYLLTYSNYVGEMVVLFFYGSRFLSVDKHFFGARLWLGFLEKYRDLEISVVRILYGFALIYTAINIKVFHQILTIEVYNQYHLVNFFHGTAAYVAAGAAVSEIAIGLCILLGLAQRLTIIIMVIFITLSLMYFGESVWPHYLLYGLSFNLFINSGDPLALDRYVVPWLRSRLLRKNK